MRIFDYFRKKKKKKEWDAYNKSIFPTTKKLEFDNTLELEDICLDELFAKIDEVPWLEYETAYGSAEKLPYFLIF
ncbi:MAG: hypothetical protein FWE13_00910 [Firmicutes bacterium]|nr:hypothetical protein [Bacillota bacterium]